MQEAARGRKSYQENERRRGQNRLRLLICNVYPEIYTSAAIDGLLDDLSVSRRHRRRHRPHYLCCETTGFNLNIFISFPTRRYEGLPRHVPRAPRGLAVNLGAKCQSSFKYVRTSPLFIVPNSGNG
jgi:hypothetical protein